MRRNGSNVASPTIASGIMSSSDDFIAGYVSFGTFKFGPLKTRQDRVREVATGSGHYSAVGHLAWAGSHVTSREIIGDLAYQVYQPSSPRPPS